ncbi:MAG: hypothetical protein EHM40_11065 [Chloroflexi bacterium]|nr:MAG: hypothetical protein EHM40_11065 [Chloroflexota bacterium]
MFETLGALLISIASLLNIGLAYYNAKKRIPSEVDKQKAEAAESLSEGAESNVNAAKISNELLLLRIAELKKDKREAWNYIAILKKQLIEAQLTIPEFVPIDTEPKIKAVQ